MIALYAGLLFFFLMTYGGFRIGYLKKGNLLCSQILSIGLLNVITYIQISLLDKKFHDPKILTAMTLVQLLTAIPSLTIEVGRGTNPLEMSQLPAIYEQNKNVIGEILYGLRK